MEITLREKCPNTDFFLVRIFLYSEWNVFSHKTYLWSPTTEQQPIENTLTYQKPVSSKRFCNVFCMNSILADIRLLCTALLFFYRSDEIGFYQTAKVFLAFIKTIIEITYVPLNIGWLTNFCMLKELRNYNQKWFLCPPKK